MSQYYRTLDTNPLEQGAFEAASSHWRTYFNDPEELRFGDEHTWDAVVTNAIAEIGIPRSSAIDINENAKLEAQFTDQKF